MPGLTLCLSVACGILRVLNPDDAAHAPKPANTNPASDPKPPPQHHRLVILADRKLRDLRKAANGKGREPELRRWHGLLSTMLLGISVNQLVAGVTISISALVVFRRSLVDPNVDLANDLGLLSVTSQLAVSTVLYRPNKWSLYVRSASFYAYVCLLAASTIVQKVTQSREGGDRGLGGRTTNWIFLVVVICYGVWVQLLVNLADSARGRKTLGELAAGSSKLHSVLVHLSWVETFTGKVDKWMASQPSLAKVVSRVWRIKPGPVNFYHLVVHTPWFRTAMGFSIAFALTAVALASAVTAKLDVNRRCAPAEESQWTFGNILALGMIAALLIPGLDAYFESRERAKHRPVDQGTQTERDDTGLVAATMASDVFAQDDAEAIVRKRATTAVRPPQCLSPRLARCTTLELEAQQKGPAIIDVTHIP
ncbi:hypothetical protein LTR36_006322 [Oleoguttula mirabilis]|uniref:Uncharacterized protein n=1 Tax=Oleoguttula mirabilis TaxID=1507867 RepID=A0AAV9JV06_9PEZI|nr:hypothetical protein LTR36_006322 [Oleoguttula mirabilis]